MKKALFYAVNLTSHSRPSVLSSMAVTSARGTQLYGRDFHGCPTHRRTSDMGLAIATSDSLQAAIGLAQEAWDRATPEVERLKRELVRAERDRHAAVKDAVKARALSLDQVMNRVEGQDARSGRPVGAGTKSVLRGAFGERPAK